MKIRFCRICDKPIPKQLFQPKANYLRAKTCSQSCKDKWRSMVLKKNYEDRKAKNNPPAKPRRRGNPLGLSMVDRFLRGNV